MDVFCGPRIPQETPQSPADLIIMSNISILLPLCEERDGGNSFMAFIAEGYAQVIHEGLLFYSKVIS